ncbi:TPA_asm: hypothetical protein [Porphyromonas phage phage030a_KCOM2803]|uniref:Uncharacterized protein n=2 Tax=root TaxID=1 RepID=A0AAT9JMD1_9CAUD
MYTFKDKAVHVAALQRERFAEVDLRILQDVAPSHPEAQGVRPPSTRHNVILHALLDVVTREEIENRREEILNPKPKTDPDASEGEDGKKDPVLPADPDASEGEDGKKDPVLPADPDASEGEDNPSTADVAAQVNDIASQADNLQERVDELEGQVSDLAGELDGEKKSEPQAPKGKKKKSTR